jgi:transposase
VGAWSCAACSTWPRSSAARHNPAIKTFYEWQLTAGKLPKVVLVACVRKFLTTLSAMVKNNKPWDGSLHGA